MKYFLFLLVSIASVTSFAEENFGQSDNVCVCVAKCKGPIRRFFNTVFGIVGEYATVTGTGRTCGIAFSKIAEQCDEDIWSIYSSGTNASPGNSCGYE